ncbi:MAG: DNA glycosylase [Candidatus Bathyarchaeia archaeon]
MSIPQEYEAYINEKISIIQQKLLKWYEKNVRVFPWRMTRDPYKILVAEIMLQRTKAEQVAPVYEEFISVFPDPKSLEKSKKEDIRAFFSRLGLLWRSDLLIKLANDLVKRFDGKVPQNREELLSLPAVGDYIADAILSFAYGVDVAVVDSNVCRILCRIFGLSARGEARRDKHLRLLAQKLVPKGKSREFNWAIIDLASIVCTPRGPKCEKCPLIDECFYATRKL